MMGFQNQLELTASTLTMTGHTLSNSEFVLCSRMKVAMFMLDLPVVLHLGVPNHSSTSHSMIHLA